MILCKSNVVLLQYNQNRAVRSARELHHFWWRTRLPPLWPETIHTDIHDIALEANLQWMQADGLDWDVPL